MLDLYHFLESFQWKSKPFSS